MLNIRGQCHSPHCPVGLPLRHRRAELLGYLVHQAPRGSGPSLSLEVFRFLFLTGPVQVPTALKLCFSPSASLKK